MLSVLTYFFLVQLMFMVCGEPNPDQYSHASFKTLGGKMYGPKLLGEHLGTIQWDILQFIE